MRVLTCTGVPPAASCRAFNAVSVNGSCRAHVRDVPSPLGSVWPGRRGGHDPADPTAPGPTNGGGSHSPFAGSGPAAPRSAGRSAPPRAVTDSARVPGHASRDRAD